MTLGVRLKELRIKKNQSLQDVADAVAASKAHIWEIERGGSKNPSADLLKKLADHFDTSVSFLIGEDPSAENAPELVALYRDLKTLSDHDRETIRLLMKRLKQLRPEDER